MHWHEAQSSQNHSHLIYMCGLWNQSTRPLKSPVEILFKLSSNLYIMSIHWFFCKPQKIFWQFCKVCLSKEDQFCEPTASGWPIFCPATYILPSSAQPPIFCSATYILTSSAHMRTSKLDCFAEDQDWTNDEIWTIPLKVFILKEGSSSGHPRRTWQYNVIV